MRTRVRITIAVTAVPTVTPAVRDEYSCAPGNETESSANS